MSTLLTQVQYTLETALSNNDVIYTTNTSYNYDRFLEFLNNVNSGKPDKIRIVYYGFEGQILISILQYDGNIIRITFDATRNQTSETYDSFYGYQIISQVHQRAGLYTTIFYLSNIKYKFPQQNAPIRNILTSAPNQFICSIKHTFQ